MMMVADKLRSPSSYSRSMVVLQPSYSRGSSSSSSSPLLPALVLLLPLGVMGSSMTPLPPATPPR